MKIYEATEQNTFPYVTAELSKIEGAWNELIRYGRFDVDAEHGQFIPDSNGRWSLSELFLEAPHADDRDHPEELLWFLNKPDEQQNLRILFSTLYESFWSRAYQKPLRYLCAVCDLLGLNARAVIEHYRAWETQQTERLVRALEPLGVDTRELHRYRLHALAQQLPRILAEH